MPFSKHLKFDIKIIKLANFIDHGLDESLFIRYYVPGSCNRQIQVDTRKIQSKVNILWNECASFEYHANSDQIEPLEKWVHVTFELRSRRTKPNFGGIMRRSSLLGRGEISWKDVMGSERMKLENWVQLNAKCGKLDGLKLPDLLVEMEVQVTKDVDLNGKRNCGFNKEYHKIESEIDIFHIETLVD